MVAGNLYLTRGINCGPTKPSESVYKAVSGKRLLDNARDPQTRGAAPLSLYRAGGNQDRRHPDAFFLQAFHNVEAVHTRYVLVDQQTARRAIPIIGKEISSRIVGLHIEPEGLEQ
jgi:hypothetical protein